MKIREKYQARQSAGTARGIDLRNLGPAVGFVAAPVFSTSYTFVAYFVTSCDEPLRDCVPMAILVVFLGIWFVTCGFGEYRAGPMKAGFVATATYTASLAIFIFDDTALRLSMAPVFLWSVHAIYRTHAYVRDPSTVGLPCASSHGDASSTQRSRNGSGVSGIVSAPSPRPPELESDEVRDRVRALLSTNVQQPTPLTGPVIWETSGRSAWTEQINHGEEFPTRHSWPLSTRVSSSIPPSSPLSPQPSYQCAPITEASVELSHMSNERVFVQADENRTA